VRILRLVAEVEIRSVGAEQLGLVRQLFETERATRHCWCMAFCSTNLQFAMGWYGGGNRRRFEELAVTGHLPMGIVASVDSQPVGWCACGPRLRYLAAIGGRSELLAQLSRNEDADVWLIACIFVARDRRSAGLVLPLLRGAIDLARRNGASAVEGWPLAAGARQADARQAGVLHVGREGVFARLGFRCVQRPSSQRVLMRLDLAGTSAS
jgi:hypothetical protein